MILCSKNYFHQLPGTDNKQNTNQSTKQSKMAATQTQMIINEFTTLVDTEKEYTRAELGKMLTEVYRQITTDKPKKTDDKPKKTDDKPKKKKSKKENDSDEEVELKKKREPTKYNLFVKEQMSIVKEEFPDLNRQDLMKKVGELWKAKKEQEKDE